MLVYPLLSSGVAAQYPTVKTPVRRTVINTMPDGRTVKAPDDGAATVEWELHYAVLTDDERKTLEDFFAAAEGSLNSFTFVDPVGNLLASSEALTDAVWEKGPLLNVQSDDAASGRKSFVLHNGGGGAQTLQQTLDAPSGYTYTFSAYLKGTAGTTVTVFTGATKASFGLGSDWLRASVTGQAADGTELACGIEVPAGSVNTVAGLQLEAQGRPTGYRQSGGRNGIYSDARFKTDVLQFTTEGPNQHSCTVKIIHADHI